MVSHHHPVKFGDHRHCVSEDVMFLVLEQQDPTGSRLNLTLMFISENMTWKYKACHINKSDPGYMRLKQQ